MCYLIEWLHPEASRHLCARFQCTHTSSPRPMEARLLFATDGMTMVMGVVIHPAEHRMWRRARSCSWHATLAVVARAWPRIQMPTTWRPPTLATQVLLADYSFMISRCIAHDTMLEKQGQMGRTGAHFKGTRASRCRLKGTRANRCRLKGTRANRCRLQGNKGE